MFKVGRIGRKEGEGSLLPGMGLRFPLNKDTSQCPRGGSLQSEGTLGTPDGS